jgi:hypothetical protein
MIRSEEEKKKMVEANKRMVDKVVKIVDPSSSSYWVGKIMEVIDHETFSIRRNKNSEPKDINMFDVRSM